ncbi:hypothetical protein C8J57DRAFT_1273423 [Mycena rebaudengoi]|nr:hypothetical protein C8J57DRAFT_1273423 [Mycena rebaudengoi]
MLSAPILFWHWIYTLPIVTLCTSLFISLMNSRTEPLAGHQSLMNAAPSSRDTPEDPTGPAHSLRLWVLAFNILAIVGFTLLAVVFLTALLSPRVNRIATWYGYMLAWMAFCIVPFLVFGHQTDLDPPPSFSACVVDSALMYASRPFAAFSTLALVVQLYLNMSARLKQGQSGPRHEFWLLVVPPIIYVIMFIWILILGLRTPDQVELDPGGFYCHLVSGIPAVVGASLVGLAILLVFLFQALIVIMLYRNWRIFRRDDMRNDHTVSLSILIRVSVFGSLPIIALALSCATYVPNLVDKIFPIYNLLLALLPVSAALIFGSQMDIVHVWMFWRPDQATGGSFQSTASNSHLLPTQKVAQGKV